MLKVKLFSVDVVVSFWAVILVSYAVVSSVAGQQLILVCLLCTFVHELGHIFMISIYKGRPQKIEIYPFEIKICADLSSLKVYKDVIVTLMGPIANGILSFISFVLYCLFDCDLMMQICVSSLSIGFMNMLPVETFDGGQLLKIALMRFFSQNTAGLVLSVCSVLFMIPMVCLGVAVLYVSKYNFSLLFIAFYLLSIYFKRNSGDYNV